MTRIFKFELVDDTEGTRKFIASEAQTFQEALPAAFIATKELMNENGNNWSIVSAIDESYHVALREKRMAVLESCEQKVT